MVFNVLVFFEFTKLLAIEQIFFGFTGLFVNSAAWSSVAVERRGEVDVR